MGTTFRHRTLVLVSYARHVDNGVVFLIGGAESAESGTKLINGGKLNLRIIPLPQRMIYPIIYKTDKCGA